MADSFFFACVYFLQIVPNKMPNSFICWNTEDFHSDLQVLARWRNCMFAGLSVRFCFRFLFALRVVYKNKKIQCRGFCPVRIFYFYTRPANDSGGVMV
jgi:hypothetical protein